MHISKLLLDLTLAEHEGVGTWHEYLSKYKIFKKLENIKSVLLAGLPEEYGVASDILVFAKKGCKITVLDDRKDRLEKFIDVAKDFNISDKIKIIETDIEKFPFKKNSFDLVTNTEAIQRVKDYKKFIKEMKRVSKKHILIFIPNAYYYSHYFITKIRTFKMKEILKNIDNIFKKDYIDMPPYPAGVSVSAKGISFSQGSKAQEREKLNKQGKKESFFISILKNFFLFFTPAFVLVEKFYFHPLKEFLSHMFFIHIIKN